MSNTEMSNLKHQVTFSPQIIPEQVQQIADNGFKTIICNRPDGEEVGQPNITDIEQACQQLGLSFKDITFSGGMLSQEMVEEFADFFKTAEQPVYMYCRSGNRSNILYQAAVQMGLLV